MIDTHAHLNFPELLNQVDKIIRDSKKAGLSAIIIASSNIADSQVAIDLAKKYPHFLWASAGIHPQKTDVKNKDKVSEQIRQLEEMIKNNKDVIVSVGECGFDFGEVPPGEEERSESEQEKLFLAQIQLGLKHNLPVAVHAREANDKAIEFLQKHGSDRLKGVFHCYSGGKKRIQRIIDLPGEWYFGVDGNLTYDQGLQNVVKKIPRDRLVLETDSPFLAPEPHRGEICTPAHLPLIAEKVAEIWNLSLKEVAGETSKNTKELFGI